ncbi:MAG: AraC family transcriptional regulator [Pseudomonadales bacterium]|nr:MAG: AraC family transcriptional regulator [Pseudomonadales bacterium]
MFGSFRQDLIDIPDDKIRVLLVSPLMREMLSEALRWPINKPECELSKAYFVAMAKLCEEWLNSDIELHLPCATDKRLEQILQFTQSNLISADVKALCQKFGFSDRSLRRHLKQDIGMSWEEYRRRARVLSAIDKLDNTRKQVGVIANEVGFHNPSAFAKAFQRLVGETPCQYRKKN